MSLIKLLVLQFLLLAGLASCHSREEKRVPSGQRFLIGYADGSLDLVEPSRKKVTHLDDKDGSLSKFIGGKSIFTYACTGRVLSARIIIRKSQYKARRTIYVVETASNIGIASKGYVSRFLYIANRNNMDLHHIC